MYKTIDPFKHSFLYIKKHKICVQNIKTGKEVTIARRVHKDYIVTFTENFTDWMMKRLMP